MTTSEGNIVKEELLEITDMRVVVEVKPDDANRFGAINENWLHWSQHRQVSAMNQRLYVKGKYNELPRKYVKKKI